MPIIERTPTVLGSALGVASMAEEVTSTERSSGPRSIEWNWRRANFSCLRRDYSEQWVAVEGREIVAHGRDPLQVVAEARDKGVRIPYVFYVGSHEEGVSWVGL